MKQLRAARRAYEIGQLKCVARRCPQCGRLKITTIADHERHERRCYSRKVSIAEASRRTQP